MGSRTENLWSGDVETYWCFHGPGKRLCHGLDLRRWNMPPADQTMCAWELGQSFTVETGWACVFQGRAVFRDPWNWLVAPMPNEDLQGQRPAIVCNHRTSSFRKKCSISAHECNQSAVLWELCRRPNTDAGAWPTASCVCEERCNVGQVDKPAQQSFFHDQQQCALAIDKTISNCRNMWNDVECRWVYVSICECRYCLPGFLSLCSFSGVIVIAGLLFSSLRRPPRVCPSQTIWKARFCGTSLQHCVWRPWFTPRWL